MPPDNSRRVLIIAGGDVDPVALGEAAATCGYIICADGGLNHARRAGVAPHAVVGDLDSACPEDVAWARGRGAAIESYPAHKDFTDLQLALCHAVERGADELIILGALGGRPDHALANLALLAARDLPPVSAVHDGFHIRAVHDEIAIVGRPGDLVSLVPLGERAAGVTTEGLAYPLRDAVLTWGAAATSGVSNLLSRETAYVRLNEGVLLVFHRRNR